MLDFFTNLSLFLSNFNALLNDLSTPEGRIIKIDLQLTVNGVAVDITMPPV